MDHNRLRTDRMRKRAQAVRDSAQLLADVQTFLATPFGAIGQAMVDMSQIFLNHALSTSAAAEASVHRALAGEWPPLWPDGKFTPPTEITG